MRRIAAAVIVSGVVVLAPGCKGKEAPATRPPPAVPAPTPADAAVAPGDWAACEAALKAAPTAPATRRAHSIIDACHPCGDWTPLLRWNVTEQAGGPTAKVIEQAMIACNAFCDPTAKMRFLGALDDARAKDTRAPWRALGDLCRDQVSAVPDARFMSAPYFALDRIARDVGKRPDGDVLLEAIEIPLPAVSLSGAGFDLPESPLTKATELHAQVSVSVAEIRVGALPRAKLGATGVTVIGDPYPGALVTPKELAAALDKLGDPVALFAPEGMPAARIAEIVAAAGTHSLQLAVSSLSGPPGWSTHGTVPIAIRAKAAGAGVTLTLDASADDAIRAAKAATPEALKQAPVTIKLTRTATVASLAKLLGALGFFEVPAVALVPPPKP